MTPGTEDDDLFWVKIKKEIEKENEQALASIVPLHLETPPKPKPL